MGKIGLSVHLQVLRDKKPEYEEPKSPSLEERVDKAIDCIDLNVPHMKQQAIEFLQKVHERLRYHERLPENLQCLLEEKIIPALLDYGHYNIGDRNA